MKHTKTVTIPAQTRERANGVTCDRCKKRFEDATDASIVDNGIDWSEDEFGVYATSVSVSTGSDYPEGVNLETRRWDICPACFDEWLKPILETECGDGNEDHVFR